MKRLLLLCFALLTIVGMSAQTVDLKFNGTDPEDGADYSVSSYEGTVTFKFSRAVTVEKGWIIPTNGTKVAIESIEGSYALEYYTRCNIAPQMKELMKAGTIKVGESFKVQLEGIKDAVAPFSPLTPKETITISLIATRLPGTLVSISKENESTINSFYQTGDAEGLITFNFSEEVNCAGIKMDYGSQEGGTYGTKTVPFETVGNSVIANLQNIPMEPEELNGQKSITLRLTKVTTKDGATIEGNLPGAPGVVTLSLKIQKTATELVYGGFECEDIDKAPYMECWVSNYVTFDAVKFSFTLKNKLGTIEIPATRVNVTSDPETVEAIIITVPMDDIAFDAGDVTVELVNAQTINQDAVEITNTFSSKGRVAEKTACLFVTPDQGFIYQSPSNVAFTFNDIVTLEQAIAIIGGEEIPLPLRNIVIKNNVISLHPYVLYNDCMIRLKVKDSKGEYITFGDNANYVTVNYTVPVNTFACTEITPAIGKATSLKEFTLTFVNPSDPDDIVGGCDATKKVVLMNKEGEIVTEGTIVAEDYEPKAIVTLAKEVTEDGIYQLVIPEATVYSGWFSPDSPNLGMAEGAIYNPELTYRYTIGDVEPTTCIIDPEQGTYDVLPTEYSFTFSRNATVTSAKMITDLTGRLGEDVLSQLIVTDNSVTLKLKTDALEGCSFVRLMLQATDILGNAITANYDDIEGFIIAEYEKTAKADLYACTAITPEAGTVTSLKEFTLTFTNPNDGRDYIGGFDFSQEIILKDKSGNKVTEGAFALTAMFASTAKLVLEKEVSAAGTYTLVIPQAAVYNSSFDEFADDFGVSFGAIYNPEVSFTYNLTPSTIQTVLSDITGEVSIYNIQGILLRKGEAAEVLKELPKGIYIVNGKKIAIEK